MKIINLEHGMPFVDEAIDRLNADINYFKNKEVVIKFIHGYGSSGVGGKIRKAVIKKLEQLKNEKVIVDYIPGTAFQSFCGKIDVITKYNKWLKNDSDYGKNNDGITYVILKKVN